MKPGFLSLNLNALGKTLEKVDLHERLYIDPDLLPLAELVLTESKPLVYTTVSSLFDIFNIMDCAVYIPDKS